MKRETTTVQDISPSRLFTHRRLTYVLEVATVLALLIMSSQVLIGAQRIGIANDHSTHVDRTETWFETGWYVPEGFIDPATNSPRFEIQERKHTYGAGFGVFAHAMNAGVGIEQWGEPTMKSEAFVGRSLAIGLLGIISAGALGVSTFAMTSSRALALWGSAALLAVPAWSGYSMFAIKDVPAGSGLTLLTAGLVLALFPGPTPTRRARRPLLILLLCLAGVWFSFGVRTALWVPVVTSLITFSVLAYASLARNRLGRNLFAVAAGVIGGTVAVSLLHYRNAATPLEWLSSAVSNSLEFQWTGHTLTAGQLMSQHPPWWYLPTWLFHSLPVLIAALFVGGTMTSLIALRRAEAVHPLRRRLGRPEAAALLWIHQAFLLPTAATLSNATMYGGLRQHLYMLPAIIALASLSAWRLRKATDGKPLLGVIVTALLIGAVMTPVLEQSQLFPYNFVYKNIIAGSIWGEWETDLHWASRREALTRVPADASAYFYVAPTKSSGGEPVSPPLRRADEGQALTPFIHEQGTEFAKPAGRDALWVVARPYSATPPRNGCVEHDNVTRTFRGERVVLSYVLLCDPASDSG